MSWLVMLSPLTDYICRMFNANVKQVINVTQVVASKMIAEGKKGSIVNVSSQVKTGETRALPALTLSSLGLPGCSGGPHCLLRHQGSSGHDNKGHCPGART